MSSAQLVLRITIVHERFGREVVLRASPADFVRGVIDRVLDMADLTDEGIAWELWDVTRPLPPNGTIGLLLAGYAGTIELQLRVSDSAAEEFELSLDADADLPPPSLAPGAPPKAAAARPPADWEAADEDQPVKAKSRPRARAESFAVEDDSEGVRLDSAEDERTTRKRATIRYYSRMNPDRVYPLRVLFTRDVVEKVVKKHVEQAATGPLAFATDAPVEIEPVLPGCACHPPKISVFLDAPDQAITFHVVPHVLGKVSGARVLVRQNHATVAEIELDIRVAQRTWVVLSGLSTFAVPAASAAMKHFGLDFKPKDGFNPYLSVANALFGHVHPVALTAALAAVTGVLYWFTRPKGRDTFWDVTTTGPAEMLARVEEMIFDEPGKALADLRDLLRAYPDYQPAWVVFAEWHVDHEEWEPALTGYTEALRLGVLGPQHYRYASHAASELGRYREALDILQRAERELPPGRVEPVTFFNMACDHCNLGEYDAAMRCLHRAVEAGYRKRESFATDEDLNPLRSRPDFQALLAELARRR